MPFPSIRHQNAAQIGVARKTNAKKVKNLTRSPCQFAVGHMGVTVGTGWLGVPGKRTFQPQAGRQVERKELVIDFETGLHREPIDGGDIRKENEK